jgi:pimeloyl-ACP methyl ester carboxylesterase
MSTDALSHQATTGDLRGPLVAATGATDRRIVAAGVTTAVLEAGTGPDVVLLHGPAEFAAGWPDVIDALSATCHVVAPDLPGHGESAAPAELDPARVVAWLDDVIAETCPAPPYLVGRVVGGAIAIHYSAEHGDRVAGVVLVDTLGLAPFEPAPPFGEALQLFLADPSIDSHARLMRYCSHDFDDVRRRLGEHWAVVSGYAVDRLGRSTTQAAAGALMAGFGMAEIPEPILTRITVPTTLIWGRHDMATPLRVAEAASRRFGWPLRVIEDAADDPALDQPEAFLAAMHAVLGQGTGK